MCFQKPYSYELNSEILNLIFKIIISLNIKIDNNIKFKTKS